MRKLKDIVANRRVTKVVLGIWLALTALFIIYKGGVEGWNNRGGDFNNYYTAASLITDGESIDQFYDNDWYAAKAREMGLEKGAKFAPFPPITAFLYLPLSGLDFMTAKRVWLIFNVFLLLFLPFRLKRIFNLPLLSALFISSLFFVPLASNFNFGQAYFVLTFCMVEAIGLVQLKSKRHAAAIILAFCALLKYFPILFILYLFDPIKEKGAGLKTYLLKQKWMLTAGLTIVGVLGLTILLFHDAYQAYLITFSDHLQGDLSGQGKHAIGFQSVDSLLNNLFVPERAAIVDMPILKPIVKSVFIAGVAWTCFKIFKRDQFRFTASNSSIFIIGAFVLIPASASYHFLFLLIPVVFIFKWLSALESKRSLIIFTMLLLLVFCVQYHHIPDIQSIPALNYIIHYPRLWSLLLLFGYLSYLKLDPKNG
ncbi:MAG: DUF2029 domain-containing protein [Crocinitomix sp.]|nr:DUF2029 domain-containing protein [Crocinitomix sp.]